MYSVDAVSTTIISTAEAIAYAKYGARVSCGVGFCGVPTKKKFQPTAVTVRMENAPIAIRTATICVRSE